MPAVVKQTTTSNACANQTGLISWSRPPTQERKPSEKNKGPELIRRGSADALEERPSPRLPDPLCLSRAAELCRAAGVPRDGWALRTAEQPILPCAYVYRQLLAEARKKLQINGKQLAEHGIA